MCSLIPNHWTPITSWMYKGYCSGPLALVRHRHCYLATNCGRFQLDKLQVTIEWGAYAEEMNDTLSPSWEAICIPTSGRDSWRFAFKFSRSYGERSYCLRGCANGRAFPPPSKPLFSCFLLNNLGASLADFCNFKRTHHTDKCIRVDHTIFFKWLLKLILSLRTITDQWS